MQQESHLDEWTHNTPQPAGRGVCVCARARAPVRERERTAQGAEG